jgi:hypothetical protein
VGGDGRRARLHGVERHLLGGPTFTLSWGGTACANSSSELADEFANTSGAEAVEQTSGTGDCVATLVTGHADDAVWAACFSTASIASIGSGYTPASNDGDGDASEYLVTDAAAGTTEMPTFGNAGNQYTMVAVALQPR